MSTATTEREPKVRGGADQVTEAREEHAEPSVERPEAPDQAAIAEAMFGWAKTLEDAMPYVHTIKTVAGKPDLLNPEDDSELSNVDVRAIGSNADRLWDLCNELRESILDVWRPLHSENERNERAERIVKTVAKAMDRGKAEPATNSDDDHEPADYSDRDPTPAEDAEAVRVFGERVAAHLGKYGMSPAMAFPSFAGHLCRLNAVGLMALVNGDISSEEINDRALDDDRVPRKHVRAAIDRWVARSREIEGSAYSIKALMSDDGLTMRGHQKFVLPGITVNAIKVATDSLLRGIDCHIDDMAAAFEGETLDDIPTASDRGKRHDAAKADPGPTRANERDRAEAESGGAAEDEDDDQSIATDSPLGINYIMDTERLARGALTLADEAVQHSGDPDVIGRFVVPLPEVIRVVVDRLLAMELAADPSLADSVDELRRAS